MSSSWIGQLWASIYDSHQPGVIEVYATILVQILAFWLPSTIFLAIDLAFPAFSHRHKIQPQQRQPTWAQISHCIRFVGTNELVGWAIFAAAHYARGFDKTIYAVTRELPPPSTLLSDLVFALLAREVSFYYIHRALHHPSVYQYVHKKHHQFTAPTSFAAQYAHPLEQLVANVLPVALPLALRRANLVSAVLFAGFATGQSAADHSGFDFVRSPTVRWHDLHHELFRVHFGSVGIMDWIHGTDVVGWDRPKKA